MIETTAGLILRTYPLTETSLIVHWLTPTSGRIATVAKGARRTKSPFHGKLDLFFLADFSFHRSRRSELHALREVSVRDMHNALRRELGYLRQASYCANLIDCTTETETPLPEIFELLNSMLNVLPLLPARPTTVLAFELKLLTQLGLQPELGKTSLGHPARTLAEHFQRANWQNIMALDEDAAAVGELRRFLQGFLLYHLGRVPKGREGAVACA